jgi:hypothetical protein
MAASPLLRRIVAADSYSCTARCVADRVPAYFVKGSDHGGGGVVLGMRRYPAAVTWANTNVLLGSVVSATVVRRFDEPSPSPAQSPGPDRPGTEPGTEGSTDSGPALSARKENGLDSSGRAGRLASGIRHRRLGPEPSPIASAREEWGAASSGSRSGEDYAVAQPEAAAAVATVAYVIEGVKTGITPAAGGCLTTRLRRLPPDEVAALVMPRSEPGFRPATGARGGAHDVHAGRARGGWDPAGNAVVPGPRHLIVTVLGSAGKRARFTDTALLARWAIGAVHWEGQHHRLG